MRLTKIVLLSFCSMVVAHVGWNKAAMRVEDTENSLTGLKRPLELASEEPQTPKKRLRSSLPGRRTKTNLKKEYLITEKLPDMKKSWERNQDHVNSLMQDSKELTYMKEKLYKHFRRVKLQHKVDTFYIPPLFHAIYALGKISDRLVTFKQLKLLELGQAEIPNCNRNILSALFSKKVVKYKRRKPLELPTHFHTDILEIVAKKTWKNIGNSILEELLMLLIDKEIFFKNPFDFARELSIQWTEFAFKIMDFLVIHQFVDHEIIKNSFKDPKIRKLVIVYAELSCYRQIQESVLVQPLYFTEHWYWPFLHESLQVLSKKEKTMINAQVLLDFKYQILFHIVERAFDEKSCAILKEFFSFFNQEKYMKEFMLLNESKKAEHFPDKFPIFNDHHQVHHQRETDNDIEILTRQEWIIHDLTKLFRLLEKARSMFRNEPLTQGRKIVNTFLFDILIFIDDFVSPGIIQRLQENPNLISTIPLSDYRFWYYIKNFYLMKISKKLANIDDKATKHFNYILTKYTLPSDWNKSSLEHKPFFVSYLTDLRDLKSLHKLQYDIYVNRKSSTGPSNHSLYRIYLGVAGAIQDVEKKLERIQNRFQI